MKSRCHLGGLVANAVILLLGSPVAALSPLRAAAAENQVPVPGEVYDLMPIGSVVLQPDGRILLADGNGLSLRFVDARTGVFGRVEGGVFRLSSDGVVDRTFGAPLKPPAMGSTARERGLVLQPDGKVLTILRGQPLVRLLPDGSLDPDFGLQSGAVKTAAAWARVSALRPLGLGANQEIVLRVSSSEQTRPITGVSFEIPPPGIQMYDRDGRLSPSRTPVLVVGTLAMLNDEPFTGVARLSSDGSTDRSFRVRLEAKHAPVALTVAVQPDARVLIGGLFTAVNGMPCTYFARLNPNGSVDEPFTRRFSREAYADAFERLRTPRLELADTASPASGALEDMTAAAAMEAVRIIAIAMQETATVVEMQGQPNSTYVLQATDALGSDEWVVIATSATDGSGMASFRDTTTSSQAIRVYRICSVP